MFLHVSHGHRSPATSGDKVSLFKGLGELLTTCLGPPAPSKELTMGMAGPSSCHGVIQLFMFRI